MNDAAFEDANDAFMSWLTSHPNTFVSNKVELHDYTEENSGRGLRATADIETDELLFSIPRDILLSWETSSLSSKLKPVEVEELGDWNLLILAMLYENSQMSSAWAPYLSILPTSFSTPMFWQDHELSELQASTLPEKIGREEADQSYKDNILPILQRYPDLFDLEKCGLDQFHRMGSLIMAYSFDSPVAGKGQPETQAEEQMYSDEEDEDEMSVKVMCPLADLLNADTVRNNARLFYEAESLDMRSTRTILAGDQIYNTYGELPNSDLLRRYGYTQSPNAADVVEVRGDAVTSLSSCLAEESRNRIDWLLDMEILDDSFEIDITGKIPKELLVTVEIMNMPDDAYRKMADTGEGVPKGSKTLFMRTKILQILNDRLAQYSTSIDHDQALLRQCELSFILRNAIAVRLGEKTILKTAHDLVSGWDVQRNDVPDRKRPLESSRGNAKRTKAS